MSTMMKLLRVAILVGLLAALASPGVSTTALASGAGAAPTGIRAAGVHPSAGDAAPSPAEREAVAEWSALQASPTMTYTLPLPGKSPASLAGAPGRVAIGAQALDPYRLAALDEPSWQRYPYGQGDRTSGFASCSSRSRAGDFACSSSPAAPRRRRCMRQTRCSTIFRATWKPRVSMATLSPSCGSTSVPASRPALWGPKFTQ